MKFETKLAPSNACIVGGYAGGPGGCPDSFADEFFKDEIPGGILCCYMIRRFGWPNAGSDEHKDLCSWNLTTPIEGLYLSVTPYLGGGNLHFAFRYNKAVGSKLNLDLGRESFLKRTNTFITRWWRMSGAKLYVWGCGKKEGDNHELVHIWNDHETDNTRVFGLWKRKESDKKHLGKLPKNIPALNWWLSEIIEKHHPKVKLPRMTKSERGRMGSPFRAKAKRAILLTLQDLMRPVFIRDIGINPFGDVENPELEKKHARNYTVADRFIGAGYTPEYWYTKATTKEKRSGE